MERLCLKSPQILHTVHAKGCYWSYKKYFFVRSLNGMIIDEICFVNEFCCSMKNKILLSMGRVMLLSR